MLKLKREQLDELARVTSNKEHFRELLHEGKLFGGINKIKTEKERSASIEKFKLSQREELK